MSNVKKVKFTAYNKLEKFREHFECNMIDLLHTDPLDAATSKLWYGCHWNQDMIREANIKIISVVDI